LRGGENFFKFLMMIEMPNIRTTADFDRHQRAEFWNELAPLICRRHHLRPANLRRADSGEHVVFLSEQSGFIVKIYAPFRHGFRREKAGLEFARGRTSLPMPEILAEGEIEGFDYLVFRRLEGVLMTRETWLGLEKRQQIEVVAQLAAGLKQLHSHEFQPVGFDWHKFVETQAATAVKRQKACGVNRKILERLPRYLAESLPLLPKNFTTVFLHGDVHFGNLRLSETKGKWRISGLFDFADSLSGFYEYDFLAVCLLMIQGQGDLQREFFRAYGLRENEIDQSLRRRQMLMTILYECSDLRRYALRLKPEAVDFSLDELERAIWNFV
jgi:hygromycin-B 7''-O-kinase